MGKDADIWLFKDQASVAAELKSGNAYTWHCEAAIAEFPGVGEEINHSAA